MKYRSPILLAVAVAALALSLAGCGLLTVSIEQRVDRFVTSLNTSTRIDTGTNFSSAASDYAAVQDGSWWGDATTGYFPTSDMDITPYSATAGFDVSNPLDVEVSISGPPIFGGTKDYKFVMVNESASPDMENWKILELYVWTGAWTLMVQ